MTIAHYLPLILSPQTNAVAPELRALAAQLAEDMSAAGISGHAVLDGLPVAYVAPEQLVTEGLPLVLHRTSVLPESPPNPHAPVAGPQSIALDPKRALAILMKKIEASRAGPWAAAARDWRRRKSFADTFEMGRQILKSLEPQRPKVLEQIDPRRALRNIVNNKPSPAQQSPRWRANSSPRGELWRAHTMPQPTMSVASRFLKRRLEHRAEHAFIGLL